MLRAIHWGAERVIHIRPLMISTQMRPRSKESLSLAYSLTCCSPFSFSLSYSGFIRYYTNPNDLNYAHFPFTGWAARTCADRFHGIFSLCRYFSRLALVSSGNLVQHLTKLHRFPVFGRTIIKVPTSTQTLDIKKTTVVDRNGNPIVVAGVVTFVLTDTIKAAFGMRSIRDSFKSAPNTTFRCTQL
jgi:hypothetical protein